MRLNLLSLLAHSGAHKVAPHPSSVGVQRGRAAEMGTGWWLISTNRSQAAPQAIKHGEEHISAFCWAVCLSVCLSEPGKIDGEQQSWVTRQTIKARGMACERYVVMRLRLQMCEWNGAFDRRTEDSCEHTAGAPPWHWNFYTELKEKRQLSSTTRLPFPAGKADQARSVVEIPAFCHAKESWEKPVRPIMRSSQEPLWALPLLLFPFLPPFNRFLVQYSE